MADALQLIRENKEKRARGEDATHLNLGYCNLIELPNKLSKCDWIENLVLIDNIKLSNLSPLKDLKNLQKLDISNTMISDLSPLKDLKNLQILYVYSTQISDLSPLKDLKNLQILYISDTQVSDLSPLKALKNLQKLYAINTKISDLTPILHLIKKGRQVVGTSTGGDIIVDKCPLTNPPIEIIEQGNEAILNYFSELKGGEVKGLEAKVILIGESEAGKTSLRTRLLKGEQAPLPTKKDRTRGLEVEIEPLTVDLRDGEQMRLNIFDFGGQTHYKPLHQFFYSHRSLYVLVTKNGDDSNEFDFWFDTAQLFGGGSPVLVVNNLRGDVPSGFNRSQFARFDAIIKDSLSDNLLTPKNFPTIRKRIEQLAEDLPLVHQTIPKTWANVRRELEQLRHHNIIRLQDYLDICAKPDNGEMDKERALHCSAYLHDIGVCLHYQQFPSLKWHIIVKNEWATEAVYRVMDDHEVNRRHGHFNLDDLERIWQPTAEDLKRGDNFRYDEYLKELLELMREFKLCYPLRLNDKEFVAPHLLPTKQEGDQEWVPDNDLQFEMEYDFMPPGLFSRFIASRYEDIAGENREFVWRDEVFFQRNNTIANVSLPSRAGKKAIIFKVQGNDLEGRKFFLTSLIDDLKKLHAETPGIKAEERIPCICDVCKSSGTLHFYPYSQLKTRKANNKKTIECIHPPFAEVEVDALLGNIFPTQKPEEESPALDKDLIRDLLKNDELEQALEILEQHAPDDCVLLQANITRIRRSSGLGMTSQEREGNIRQQTIQAVLDWLNGQ